MLKEARCAVYATDIIVTTYISAPIESIDAQALNTLLGVTRPRYSAIY